MPPPRSHYGPIQLADRLGLRAWQVDRARTLGLIPAPDLNGRRWSAALVEPLAARVPEILAAVGEHPGVGANRAAEQLTDRSGIVGIDRSDVEALAERGLLRVVGFYKDWPLYDLAELQAPPDLPAAMDALRELVADRQAWLAASLSARDAAERLGWRLAEFERVVAERGLRSGRFGRYLAADVKALGPDLELAEQVAAERLLGPDQAAEHLEIRRTDFDYVVAAGWVRPAAWTQIRVGRRRLVSVPLYRIGDLDVVRDLPDVDGEAVRACPGGRSLPAPRLRPLASRPAPSSSAGSPPRWPPATTPRCGPSTTGPATAGGWAGSRASTASRPSSRSPRRSPPTPPSAPTGTSWPSTCPTRR